MTQMLLDHIDQLDLALDQLALRDRNFDRFAIMLVDNVVELTLHRHAMNKQAMNKSWYQSTQTNFSVKDLEEAVGPKFDAKVAFALKTGLLTKAMSQSISWLHSFRNSSYHAGLKHDGILHSLANFYVLNCCDLLRRYKPVAWSVGSQRVSHRAAKYLGSASHLDILLKGGVTFDLVWERIGAVAANMQFDLAGDLARDMGSVVDQVDEQIKFIVANAPGPNGYTRKSVVIDAQAWAFAFSEKGVTYAQENGYPGVAARGPALASWLEKHYKAPFPTDPIPSWRSRLHSLGQERDTHKALDKYCGFMVQTRGLRDDLSRRAMLLDEYIQEQIDLARGK